MQSNGIEISGGPRIAARGALATLIVCTALAGCTAPSQVDERHTVSPDWRSERHETLATYADNLRPDIGITLSVSDIARFDGQTVLVGGSYRTPAASFRSVLLRSDDGGATWHDTGVWLGGSDVWDIHVLDAKHAWVVTCWSIEGQGPPFDVFITRDGGETWQRSRHRLPFEHVGIPLGASIHFATPKRGQFRVTSTSNETQHYVTDDGGRMWRLAHRTDGRVRLGDLVSIEPQRDHEAGVIRLQWSPSHAKPNDEAATLPLSYRLEGVEPVPVRHE